MPAFTQAAENIVRYTNGNYYLSAKIDGKKVRLSLGTNDLRIAKIKRDAELDRIRITGKASKKSSISTLADALRAVGEKKQLTPGLKTRTRKYYKEMIATIIDSLPDCAVGEWDKAEAARWWRGFCKAHCATQANNALRLVRDAIRVSIEAGLIRVDFTAELGRQRIKRRLIDHLPDTSRLDEIVQSIRENGSRFAKEAANMVEFLAWSGLRIDELRAVRWEHIGTEWLVVTGGKEGTKNHEQRRVPINERLRAVVDRMRHDNASGALFAMVTPYLALRNACRRLNIPHLRVHDLRHRFATHAIECGIDIPTVSRWLGHKDGGALCMKTYGHLRDDHSLKSAAKMR
jgi:integrase